MIKKTNNEITKTALKEAYQLVQTDLFNSFSKMKDGQSVRLTNIGTFEKKLQRVRSGLTKKIHQYYQINFRMSSVLKEALAK